MIARLGAAADSVSLAPANWDQGLRLPEAHDRHPDPKIAHPMHLHGFFFLPLDEQFQPIRPMAWKDTLDVPIDGTIRFVVVFDERPGMWMFHCHILDHADGGLMGHVHLRPDSSE